MTVAVLLRVLQQRGSFLEGGVLLGVAQPALSIVLHPVRPGAVAQQEVLGLVPLQQQAGPCGGGREVASVQCQLRSYHIPQQSPG